MNRKSSVPVIVTVLLVISLCCLGICLVLFASGAFILAARGEQNNINEDFELPDHTDYQLPTPVVIDELPQVQGAYESLMTLQQAAIPINNPIDLGMRLGGKSEIPETLFDPDAPYQVGESKEFWVTNVDTNENFRITTTLRYRGDHVYIWIENGVNYEENDLKALGDTFDDEIYPTNREFFGSEWSPGVDGDPRIYIVYAGGLGQSLAGYYSSADQLHPEAHEYSNAHEMFLINSDNVYLWEEFIYGTLAHEFQHMIHWYTDMNEETWLNEGFSMLAELINGFDPGGFDYSYVRNPDLQLTDWGDEVGSNAPHYGAAFLFTTYFLDRFGEEATKAVVAHEQNGMESIDTVLWDLDIRDPLTNEVLRAEDVFADWAIANFLGDPHAVDGRYFYSNYPTAPLASPTQKFSTCPTESEFFDVAQFGVDYVEIACDGDYTLSFRGNTSVAILPIDPYSGKYYFWSNMGDHSNMSLERTFDLTGIEGAVEMTYQTWYDLEQDYDYVFVSASVDGEKWDILNTTSCTIENPSGNSYGCGLNGKTSGWQEESVDLSRFAGGYVTVRFDYVTDAAVNGAGMVIDDIRVDAIQYFADLEEDDGGWQAEGFVRIQNLLPQTFRVSMITFGNETEVTYLELDEDNNIHRDISIGEDVRSVVLVISGSTPFTRQRAYYELDLH